MLPPSSDLAILVAKVMGDFFFPLLLAAALLPHKHTHTRARTPRLPPRIAVDLYRAESPPERGRGVCVDDNRGLFLLETKKGLVSRASRSVESYKEFSFEIWFQNWEWLNSEYYFCIKVWQEWCWQVNWAVKINRLCSFSLTKTAQKIMQRKIKSINQ